MQTISFAEGNEQHLKDCMEALCRSALGEKVSSSPGSAENAILEGICKGNLSDAREAASEKLKP